MTKKKILIDAREFTPTPTGTRMMITHIIRGLCKSGRYEVIVAINQNSALDSAFPDDTCQNTLKAIKAREYITIIYDQLTLKKIALDEKVDFFYSPYPKLPLSPIDGCFKISSIFDLTYLNKKFSCLNPCLRFLYGKFLLKLYASRSDAIITLSETALNEISNQPGIHKEKISVVYPAVDEIFKPMAGNKRTDIITRYRLPSENGYILYLGNPRPHKNFQNILSAYLLLSPLIRRKYPLVAIGIDKKLQPPRLADGNIIFPGRIAYPDLPAIYGAASVFVFPSLSEGFGLPPLEAMACGCPVAASNTSSMPEVLKDAALYFDPLKPETIAVAIEELLTDDKLRDIYIKKGIERAGFFTPDKTFEMFEKVLTSARLNR